jgi:hypothetical protein
MPVLVELADAPDGDTVTDRGDDRVTQTGGDGGRACKGAGCGQP